MNDEISKRCLSTDDIYDIIDGEATEELVSYFEEHIKSCEKCRSEYENVKKLKAALRDYTSAPSADFTKNTLARMKTVERNPFIRITGSKAFKTTAALAACLVLVFAVCSRGLIDRIAESQDSANEKLNTVSATNEYSLKNGDAEAYSEDDSTETKSFSVENEVVGKPDAYEVVEEPIAPNPTEPSSAEEPAVAPMEPVAPMVPEAPVAPVAPEEPIIHPVAPPIPGDYIPSDSYIDPNEANSPANIPSVPMPEVPEDYVPTLPTYPDGSTIPSVEWVDPPAAGTIPTTECPVPPTPVEPPIIVITPPTASDVFSDNPEIPDYVYVPTPVVSDAIVTEALYDHETLLVDIYDPITDGYIYLTRWEGDSAVSQKTWIETAYCGEPKGEIVLPEDNTIEEDIIVVDPSEAIVPVVPTEPEPPSPERIVDGMYIIDDVLRDGSFELYWFADECYYRLVLPIKYKDGNETRFKELNLLPNPLKQ